MKQFCRDELRKLFAKPKKGTHWYGKPWELEVQLNQARWFRGKCNDPRSAYKFSQVVANRLLGRLTGGVYNQYVMPMLSSPKPGVYEGKLFYSDGNGGREIGYLRDGRWVITEKVPLIQKIGYTTKHKIELVSEDELLEGLS